MRHLIFKYCSVSLIIFFFAASSYADSTSVLMQPKEMRETLGQIHELLIDVHPEPYNTLNKDEFEALYAKLLERCERPMPVDKFYFIANELVTSLHDAHTALSYDGEDLFLPVQFAFGSDGLGIVETTDEFEQIKNSKVLTIEGISVEELVEQLSKIISAENIEHVKAMACYSYLNRKSVLEHIAKKDLNFVHIEVIKDGLSREVILPMRTTEVKTQHKEPYFWYEFMSEISAGYFKLNACMVTPEYDSAVKTFFAELKEQKYQRLIIDLRGNGGGDSRVLSRFLGHMPGSKFKSCTVSIRYSKHAKEQGKFPGDIHYRLLSLRQKIRGCFESWLNITPYYKKSKEERALTPYTGEVYILTDRVTCSSANMFAFIFSDNDLATTLGEKTGNSPTAYGDLLFFPFSHGLELRISYKLFVRPDPSRDPADGLVPDILIPTTLADIFAERDPQLEWFIRKFHENGAELNEAEIVELLPQWRK